jgi:hypothetical protein
MSARVGLVVAGQTPEEFLGERIDPRRISRGRTEQVQPQGGFAETADVPGVESSIVRSAGAAKALKKLSPDRESNGRHESSGLVALAWSEC